MRAHRVVGAIILLLTVRTASFAKDANFECHFIRLLPGTAKSVPVTTVTTTDDFGIEATQRGAKDGDHTIHLTVYDGNGRESYQIIRAVEAKSGKWSFAVTATPNGSHGGDAPGQWNYVLELDGKALWTDFIVVTNHDTSK